MRRMQDLALAGMVVKWEDYFTVPATDWQDWLIWKEAEIVRLNQEDKG